MYNPLAGQKPGNGSFHLTIPQWRVLQVVVWLIGAFILFCLYFFPGLGLKLFWNLLIPVAPALFVFGIGIWRNVCPLATTILLPRHSGLSKKKILSFSQAGKLNMISTIALLAIVPLRHPIFNNNGKATAIMLTVMAVTGMILGLFYEWKSAWCSGLCPIHPVEKLYGGNTLISVPNAHCDKCMKCITPCPDTTPNINPESSKKTIYHKISGWVIVGGLPGFIWGWFHVPDNITGMENAVAIFSYYKMPLLGLFVSICLYGILSGLMLPKHHRALINCFAAMSVSCYYWYRIPSLFGFGAFGDDGLLISLRPLLPSWSIYLATVLTTLVFFCFIVLRGRNMRSWLVRPEYGKRNSGARSINEFSN